MKLLHFVLWLIVTYLVGLVSLLVMEVAIIDLTGIDVFWPYIALSVAMIVYTVFLGGIRKDKHRVINSCFNSCLTMLSIACITVILLY